VAQQPMVKAENGKPFSYLIVKNLTVKLFGSE
jgi:hypothetical protein